MEKGAEKIAEVGKMKMEESIWAFPILDQEGFLRSLKRKWPVCEYVDDDEEIPLMEFCRRMKKEQKTKTIMRTQVSIRKEQKTKTIMRTQVSMRSPLSAKCKKKNPLIRSLISVYEEQDKRKNKLEEEENKNKLEEKEPIPVFEDSFSDFDIDSGMESEEEVLGDGDRDEYDRGSKFVLNENSITYTRLKHPIKVYYRRRSKRGSVLYDPSYPVPTVTKLALDRYNAIEGTNYKYVGLVKAYRIQVDGSRYTVRFKARLPDKRHPINFQAMIWQHIRNSKNEALVDVDFVHPLP